MQKLLGIWEAPFTDGTYKNDFEISDKLEEILNIVLIHTRYGLWASIARSFTGTLPD